MGALVIASDLGGAGETVVDGTGYRHPAGDVTALGERLAFAGFERLQPGAQIRCLVRRQDIDWKIEAVASIARQRCL